MPAWMKKTRLRKPPIKVGAHERQIVRRRCWSLDQNLQEFLVTVTNSLKDEPKLETTNACILLVVLTFGRLVDPSDHSIQGTSTHINSWLALGSLDLLFLAREVENAEFREVADRLKHDPDASAKDG